MNDVIFSTTRHLHKIIFMTHEMHIESQHARESLYTKPGVKRHPACGRGAAAEPLPPPSPAMISQSCVSPKGLSTQRAPGTSDESRARSSLLGASATFPAEGTRSNQGAD